MDSLLQDLRHSVRMFRQSRGFSAAAVRPCPRNRVQHAIFFSIVNAAGLPRVGGMEASWALTALIAVWIPAIRATRINPIDALRYE